MIPVCSVILVDTAEPAATLAVTTIILPAVGVASRVIGSVAALLAPVFADLDCTRTIVASLVCASSAALTSARKVSLIAFIDIIHYRATRGRDNIEQGCAAEYAGLARF